MWKIFFCSWTSATKTGITICRIEVECGPHWVLCTDPPKSTKHILAECNLFIYLQLSRFYIYFTHKKLENDIMFSKITLLQILFCPMERYILSIYVIRKLLSQSYSPVYINVMFHVSGSTGYIFKFCDVFICSLKMWKSADCENLKSDSMIGST